MSWEENEPPDSQVLLKPGESVLVVGIHPDLPKRPQCAVRVVVWGVMADRPLAIYHVLAPNMLTAALPFTPSGPSEVTRIEIEWV